MTLPQFTPHPTLANLWLDSQGRAVRADRSLACPNGCECGLTEGDDYESDGTHYCESCSWFGTPPTFAQDAPCSHEGKRVEQDVDSAGIALELANMYLTQESNRAVNQCLGSPEGVERCRDRMALLAEAARACGQKIQALFEAAIRGGVTPRSAQGET